MGNTLPTFYTGCNFSGAVSSLAAGRYDLNQIGLPNDSIQSIKVPKGFMVTLFEHGSFQGGTAVINATGAPVDANYCSWGGLAKFNNGTTINKNISSILVEQVSGFENSEERKSNNRHKYWWIYMLVLVLLLILFINREKIIKTISK